jgi:hypothetical protein
VYITQYVKNLSFIYTSSSVKRLDFERGKEIFFKSNVRDATLLSNSLYIIINIEWPCI